MRARGRLWGAVISVSLGMTLLVPTVASAHCDGLDGPVVMDAKRALEKGDVTPVLKWVSKDDEAAVRAAFAKTRVVRSKGAEATLYKEWMGGEPVNGVVCRER